MFGFEGALAAKNIKRNRKRYRTTVFSIIISVVLFITFKSYIDMALNVYENINESNNIHFSVVNSGNTSKDQPLIKNVVVDNINKLAQVQTSYKMYNASYFDATIDKSREVEAVRNIGGVYNDVYYSGANKTLLGASILVYDEKFFEVANQYLRDGKIDIDEIYNQNGVIIIGKNKIHNGKTDNNYYGAVADLKVRDEINLQIDGLRNGGAEEKIEFGKGAIKKVKVLAILENEAKAELEKIISTEGDLKLINIIDQNRSTKSVILMVKILLYGFVVVVSLIGSVNIINTLTTNIILRRREFAALKSIGLTQKGLRKMITLEGLLYGIMGSIYGSVIGSLLSYAIYNGMNNMREQSYVLPFQAIAIAVIGAMLIGYLSILAPLKRIKNENLIEAVREDF